MKTYACNDCNNTTDFLVYVCYNHTLKTKKVIYVKCADCKGVNVKQVNSK